jgi:methyl-accepting chemotaxis protein
VSEPRRTHIAGVSQAANETGTVAAEVLSSASALAQLSDALRSDFDRFVGDIRAACAYFGAV